jgi:WS/DGAT/MGAT family acyltransferase
VNINRDAVPGPLRDAGDYSAVTGIKQLSREDVMFIAGETDTIYQHVGILLTLDTGDCPDFGFETFYRHCAGRIARIPRFRWKLQEVPLGLDRPYWVEDEDFSFDHHIKRVALPEPGDRAALCEVASDLYSNHLDRSRPLWELWLIEGAAGGNPAFLLKFHHCLMDGEGAFRVIAFLCDVEPEPKAGKTVDAQLAGDASVDSPGYPERSARALRHLAGLPREAARSTYDLLRPAVLKQLTRPLRAQGERTTVPTARFNGQISSKRGLVITSLPLAEIKTVKSSLDASLNDVVLALVGSTVRTYLLDAGALPGSSLRASVPVSLREAGDEQMSNRVTSTTITLATDLADPLERLREINRESQLMKLRIHGGETGMVELFQIMPPILVSTLMDAMPMDQAAQMMGANLIVSNVRGPAQPLYLAGARIEGIFPMSILLGGLGLNVTCGSYCDRMDFGITVDPELVPHHARLADGLRAALDDYLALCRPKRKRARRSPRDKA